MKDVLEKARAESTAGAKELILKGSGLREVDVRPCYSVNILYHYQQYFFQNVFWKINNSDPYSALSFDRLHTFPGGLFRQHLWGHVKVHSLELPRQERGEIDNMYVFRHSPIVYC